MFEIDPSRKIMKSENVKSDNNTVQQRAFLNEPQDTLELSTKKKKKGISFGSAIRDAIKVFQNSDGTPASPKAVAMLKANSIVDENFTPEYSIIANNSDNLAEMPIVFQRKLAIDMYKGKPNSEEQIYNGSSPSGKIKYNDDGKPSEIVYYGTDDGSAKRSETFEYARKRDGSPVLIKQNIYSHDNNDKTLENEINFHKHHNGIVTISTTDGRQMSYSLRHDTIRNYENTPKTTQPTTQTVTQTTPQVTTQVTTQTQPIEQKPNELFVRPKPVYPNKEYDSYQKYKINSKLDNIKAEFLNGKDENSTYAFQTITPVLEDLEKLKNLILEVKDPRVQTEISKLLAETKDYDLPTTFGGAYTHIDTINNYSNLIKAYHLAKIAILTQEDLVTLDEKNYLWSLADKKYIDSYNNGNESFNQEDKYKLKAKFDSIDSNEFLTPQEKEANKQELLNDARVHLISQYMTNIPYDNQDFRQYISDNYLKQNLPEKYRSDLKNLENVREESLTLSKYGDFTYESLKNFHELNDVAKEHFLKHKDMCRGMYLRNENHFFVEKPYDALASLSEEEWNIFEKRNLADVLDVITGYNISTFKEKTGANIHKAVEMSDADWKKLNDFDLLNIGRTGKESSYDKNRNLKFTFDEMQAIVDNLSYSDWDTAKKRGLIDMKGSFNDYNNYGQNIGVPILIASTKIPDSTFRFLKNIGFYKDDTVNITNNRNEAFDDVAKGIEFLSKSHGDVYNNVSTLLDNGFSPEIAIELVGIGANNYNRFGKYLTGKAIELKDKGLDEYKVTRTLPMYVDLQMVNGKADINELSIEEKRALLKNLIKYNAQLFDDTSKGLFDSGIVPKNQEEYCSLLPKLVKSIGIDTRPVTQETIDNFVSATSGMAEKNSEFMNTKFTKQEPTLELEYPRGEFITNVLAKVSDLPDTEKMKVYDYFGFDLKADKNNVIQMHGYPINVNNGVKLSAIADEKTKAVVEEVRPLVEKFSRDNKVTIAGKPEFTKQINDIVELFPEFRSIIGKEQHGTHDFSVDKHSLKVLQGVMSDPRYETLSNEDKKLLNIATLLHDLTKAEKAVDKTHPRYSAYDAYHIISKMNMSEQDKIRVYQIIKNHDWLEQYNGKVKEGNDYRDKTPQEKDNVAKNIAFELKDGNNFELANILTKADMMAVKETDGFFSRFEDAFNEATAKIKPLVENIQQTAIHLPQTKIPKASELKVDGENVIEETYHTKDGQQLKFKRVNLKPNMDMGALGFEKGLNSNDLNVIVHALDYDTQSATFQALGSVDSDSLLSTSYVNYAKGNYHVFRQQGFILDVNSADIQAGTYKDFGSGYGKDLETLKNDYLFNGKRKTIRNFMSDNMKERLNLSDKEYQKLYTEIADKSMTELDESHPKVAKAIREMFMDMDIHKRKYGRDYNEWLVSRPKIQGVFIESLKYKYEAPPEFLVRYAAENDLPIIYFGE